MDIRQLVGRAFALVDADKRPRSEEGEKRRRGPDPDPITKKQWIEIINAIVINQTEGSGLPNFTRLLLSVQEILPEIAALGDFPNVSIKAALQKDYELSFPYAHRIFRGRLPPWFGIGEDVPDAIKWIGHMLWTRVVYRDLKESALIGSPAEDVRLSVLGDDEDSHVMTIPFIPVDVVFELRMYVRTGDEDAHNHAKTSEKYVLGPEGTLPGPEYAEYNGKFDLDAYWPSVVQRARDRRRPIFPVALTNDTELNEQLDPESAKDRMIEIYNKALVEELSELDTWKVPPDNVLPRGRDNRRILYAQSQAPRQRHPRSLQNPLAEMSYALIAAEKRPREAGEGEKRQRKLPPSFYAELIKGLAFGVIDGVVDIDFAFHLAVHRQAMRQLGSDEDTDRLIGEAGTNAPILNVLKQGYATSFPTVHRLFEQKLPLWYNSQAYDGVPEVIKWLSHTMWSRWVFDEMKKHSFADSTWEGLDFENPPAYAESPTEDKIELDERNWEKYTVNIHTDIDLPTLEVDEGDMRRYLTTVRMSSGVFPVGFLVKEKGDDSIDSLFREIAEISQEFEDDGNPHLVSENNDIIEGVSLSGNIAVSDRFSAQFATADADVDLKTDLGKLLEFLRTKWSRLDEEDTKYVLGNLRRISVFTNLLDDDQTGTSSPFWKTKVYALYVFSLLGFDFVENDARNPVPETSWYKGPRDGDDRSDGLVPRDFITFGGVSPLRSKIRGLGREE